MDIVQKQKPPLSQFIRERRFLLISILSWVVMVLLTVFVMVPRIQKLLSIKTENEKQQKSLDLLQEKARFLETFKNDDFKKLNDSVKSILPSTKPFLPMLFSLEQLARDEGVIFSGLSVNPGPIASPSASITEKEAKETFSNLDLNIKILGTSDQISTYIDKLATITPVVDVKTFSAIPRASSRSSSTANSSTANGSAPSSTASPSASLYEADVKLSSLYAPIFINVDVAKLLPALTKEENEYARNSLLKYKVYTPTAPTNPVDTSGLGKDDPFGL